MRIITEQEFWVCTEGAIPTQFQGTRESLHDLDGNLYITKEDKSTVGWLDFGCKKYMLLAALAVAAVVVLTVAVGVLTVATGGMGLVAVCAVAGLAGGAVSAVVGGLLCGQKLAGKREWIDCKVDFILQCVPVITGYHEMTCPAGGVIRFAPNIKSWTDAIGYATLNYTSELVKCALAGAAVGTVGTLLGVGAVTVPGTGGLVGKGVNFAGRAMTLAKPTVMSVLKNVGLSFGPIGGSTRVLAGAESAVYTHATGGINKQGEEASATNEFFKGALPEYEFASRIYENGLSSLRWTDALFLLYLLNIKTDPPGTFRDSSGNLRYARGNQWSKQPGGRADSLDPRRSVSTNGRPYENGRPNHKKGLDEQVWEANKDANGKVYDPVTGEEIQWNSGDPRRDVWSMGHKPGYEYRHLYKSYTEGRITKQQFLEYYNNPKYYRPETPQTSSGHTHELNTSSYDFDQ